MFIGGACPDETTPTGGAQYPSVCDRIPGSTIEFTRNPPLNANPFESNILNVLGIGDGTSNAYSISAAENMAATPLRRRRRTRSSPRLGSRADGLPQEKASRCTEGRKLVQQARAQERSQQLEERKASRIKSSESLTEDDDDGAKTEMELATSLPPRFGRSLRDQRGKKTYQWNTR